MLNEGPGVMGRGEAALGKLAVLVRAFRDRRRAAREYAKSSESTLVVSPDNIGFAQNSINAFMLSCNRVAW